ncbi:MAG TPA: hypothetical protein VK462_00350 [Nitrososphaeraceae archaeon]|nr:hypothetical protein [Nitrososphaeraceae archaeon]
MPELQKYLNAEVIDKNKNLIILKNDAINGEFDLGKFDPPIDLLSKDQIVKADIKAFIEFEKISLKGDTADVYFKYDIEGVGCEAKYFLVNCNWRLSSKRLWEN